MEESILKTIRKLVGLDPESDDFDTDLIVDINTVLILLYMDGVGDKAFTITGTSETWKDFIGDRLELETVKSFIHYKVKMMFDPPTSQAAIQSINEILKELEFKIYIEVDTGNTHNTAEEEE